MWFEFSSSVTEIIERAETENVPLQFYNLKSRCYQGIHTCEGDLIIICNAMADYADLLMEFVKQSKYDGYRKAFYEVHAERCRKISRKLQEQIGYDRDATIERCQKKKSKKEPNDDIGEDAMVLVIKKAREKKGENDGKEKNRGDSENRSS